MSLNCGIVGLPNVGKSTIFKALTSAPAEAANYPFCTIEPNIGRVALGDHRMDYLQKVFSSEKQIPTFVEFVDIAGLVKGASKGEGLGNQFLGHIRSVDAIAHVVRCFQDDDIIHVNGKVDPLSDIETINIELALADLDVVQRKIENLPKLIKSQNKEISTNAKMLEPILARIKKILEDGSSIKKEKFSEEELMLINDLNLITLKPTIYVCNVDEDALLSGNAFVEIVKQFAIKEDSSCVVICGKVESEISVLETVAERKEFMSAVGIAESGLDTLSKAVYKLLGLNTYFTAGPKEIHAWTFKSGTKAPQAAGIIHTDFEKGFIRAEIYAFDDLQKFGTELKVKEAGKLRLEGKEYTMADGDIVHFRFNV
jgi:GTP-binding protein YchF